MARTLVGMGAERTNRLILIGAVALALVAAVLVFAGLNGVGTGGGGGSIPGGTVSVVVAAQDIPAGTKVSADQLTTALIPSKSVVPGAVTDKKAAAGLVTLYPLQKNDQVSTAKLGQNKEALGFTGVIPAGMRAVAIPISESTSVGGLIVAGDHVDITAVVTRSLTGASAAATATTLLQNVLVLAVGQNAARPTARLDANGNPLPASSQTLSGPSNTDPNAKAKTITVAVDPKDVGALALATDQGTVYLSLRPPGETAGAAPGAPVN